MYFLLHPISSLNHLVARLMTDQITFLMSIVLFIIVACNYKKSFWAALDQMVSEWALDSQENFLKSRAEDFAIFGNAIFHILFSVLLSIILFFAKHKFSLVIAVLFVLIFSWGLNRLMKLIYKRTRPRHMDNGIRRRLSYCFPSGHVMASIPIYFFGVVIYRVLYRFCPGIL